MKRQTKTLRHLFSFLLALTLLLGSGLNIYASEAEPPEGSSASVIPSESMGETPESESLPPGSASIPESVAPDPSSIPDSSVSVPESLPPDPSSMPDSSVSVPESLPEDPSSVAPDSSLPEEDSSAPEEDPEAVPEPETEESAFVPLEMVDFSPLLEAEYGQEVTLQAALNRDDVAVSYQWQIDLPAPKVEEPELLYDYSEDLTTDYYFPYFDVTEAELLEINPDAVWPGIEMYLEAVEEAEAAGGSAADVVIENGAANTVTERLEAEGAAPLTMELPDWQDIEGATANAYTFIFGEENEGAQYRCVVNIIDEAYLAEAAENTEDVYGAAAAEVLAATASEPTPESEPAPESEETPAESIGSAAAEAAAPPEDFVLPVESELISQPILVALPPFMAPMPMATPVTPPALDGAWITGLDETMEYITDDTYQQYPETKAANNKLWTYLGEGLENRQRPDGTTYIRAGLTIDGKLPVLSAWYGKTVHFRRKTTADIIASIDIPAYTGKEYTTGISTLYKDAVSVLNVRVYETGVDFYDRFLSGLRYQPDTGYLQEAGDTAIILTDVPLTPVGTIVPGTSFNENAEAFLKDAEGNYRYDSVLVGVNVNMEPDISGAAAWALQDYIAAGYGFMTGHDMLYAYGGVTSETYVPDINSTRTPYYQLNTKIDGHWNMNWLMGVNKHYTDAEPHDAKSLVLCIGDYRDKSTLYGEFDAVTTSMLRIANYTGAAETVNDRNPTNYPYNSTVDGVGFGEGVNFISHATHSNQQIAYGTVWLDFSTNSLANYGSGRLVEDRRANGYFGTNNFYLTTNGNFALNQIGHIVYPDDYDPEKIKSTMNEGRILANTIMHISQRQQCQICQSQQGGHSDVHFVHRIYDKEDLAKIGDERYSFTHPLDGCYMLAADIHLPAGWKPIQNFKGHFSADNYGSENGALLRYRITRDNENIRLFEQSPPDEPGNNPDGWNLGTNPATGYSSIGLPDGTRTTGIARVSGFLAPLYNEDGANTQNTDWANHTVVVYGTDGVEYSCVTNSEGKYVLSNLPCTGKMPARVFRPGPGGSEVTEFGPLRVNILPEFWDTCDTTAIYKLPFSPTPVNDASIYEGQSVTLTGGGIFYATPVTDIQWQVRFKILGNESEWINMENSGLDHTVNPPQFQTVDGEGYTATTLSLRNVPYYANLANFRAVFREGSRTANTFGVREAGKEGQLTVLPRPIYLRQAQNREVYNGEGVSFEFEAEFWKKPGDADFLAKIEYKHSSSNMWSTLDYTIDFNNNTDFTHTTTQNGGTSNPTLAPHLTKYRFTIRNAKLAMNGYEFRVHFYWPGQMVYAGQTATQMGTERANNAAAQRVGRLAVRAPSITATTPSDAKVMLDAGQNYSSTLFYFESTIEYEPGTSSSTGDKFPPPTVTWVGRNNEPNAAYRPWNAVLAEINSRYGAFLNMYVRYSDGAGGWGTSPAPIPVSGRRYKIVTRLYLQYAPIGMDTGDVHYWFAARATTTHLQGDELEAASGPAGVSVDYAIDIKSMEPSPAPPYPIHAADHLQYKYEDLYIIAPNGLRTVEVRFQGTGFDARNRIDYAPGAGLLPGDLQVSGNQHGWTFKRADPLSAAQWQAFLRQIIFYVYDAGEATIYWGINEENPNATYNPDTGQYYEYVDAPGLKWTEAYTAAGGYYNASLNASGSLMSINSPGEQTTARNLAAGRLAWVGGTRGAGFGNGSWTWNGGPAITETPYWAAGQPVNIAYNDYMALDANGNWLAEPNSDPINMYVQNKWGVPLGEHESYSNPHVIIDGAVAAEGRIASGGGSYAHVFDTISIPYNQAESWWAVTYLGNGGSINATWWVEQGHKYFIAACGGNGNQSTLDAGTEYSWNQAGRGTINISTNMGVLGQNNLNGAVMGTFTAASNQTLQLTITPNISSPKAVLAVVRYFVLYDLTEAYGAGNEPGSYNTVHMVADKGYNNSDHFLGTREGPTAKQGYIVEYGAGLPGFARSNKTAGDYAKVGANIARKPVLLRVSANEKIYNGVEENAVVQILNPDGTPMPPADRAIIENYLRLRYSTGRITGVQHAAAVPGGGAINQGEYEAQIVFDSAAAQSQFERYYELDPASDDGVRFRIRARGLIVLSEGNDKVYDGATNIVVRNNLRFAPRVDNDPASPYPPHTGVIAPDTVALDAASYNGFFASPNQTETKNPSQVGITVSATDPFGLINNGYGNYYVLDARLTGAILQHRVAVHSLYLYPDENPASSRNPQNVMMYSGYADRTVMGEPIVILRENIVIESRMPGTLGTVLNGELELSAASYKAVYSTKDAGEELNPDGTRKWPIPELFLHLVPNPMTVTDRIEVAGNNLYENYFIEEEEFSGAIYRAPLDVSVQYSDEVLYGQTHEIGVEDFSHAGTYSASEIGAGTNLEINALLANDTLSIDDTKSHFVFDGNITETSGAGHYPASFEGLTEDNYAVLSNYVLMGSVSGVLSIRPVELIISVDGDETDDEDDGYTKFYGDPNPPFDVRYGIDTNGDRIVDYGMFVNGDTPETALEGDLEFCTNCGGTSPVVYTEQPGVYGSYGVWTNQGLSCVMNENGEYNYDPITWVNGTITVLPRPITIIVHDKEKIYGEPDPEIEYTVVGDFPGNTFFDDLVITREREAGETDERRDDAGVYSYLLDESQLDADELRNYDIVYEIGALTIHPRPIRIVVYDKEKRYGEFDPPIEHDVFGDYPGSTFFDNLVFTREHEAGETDERKDDVGVYSYLFDESQLDAHELENYDVVYDIGALTILPIPLRIIANDAERPMGVENPRFTVEYEGFVNGEGPEDLGGALHVYCPADRRSPPGEYEIVPSGHSSNNYDIEYIDGTLTVYGELAAVKAADRQYVDPNESVTYTISVTNMEKSAVENVLVTDVLTGGTNAIVPVESPDYVYYGNGVFSIPYLAAGQTVVITYTYTAAMADAGAILSNSAVVTVLGVDEAEWPSNTVEVVVNLPVRELEITKSASVSAANPGDVIQYTITVRNATKFGVEQVLVTDVMTGASGTIVPQASSEYLYLPSGAFLIPSLAPWQTVMIIYTYTATVADVGSTLTNAAVATTPDAEGESWPSEEVNVIVRQPTRDLELSKSASISSGGEKAVPGDVIRYSIVVSNTGDSALENVQVSDDFTGNAGEIDVPADARYTYDETNSMFNIPIIDIGESITIEYTYTVLPDDAGTTLINTAEATVPGEDEPWPSNTVEVEVLKRDLELTKSASISSGGNIAYAGDTVTYTITATNTGTVPLENVVIVDDMTWSAGWLDLVVPAGSGYTAVKDPDVSRLTFTLLLPLLPGESVTITYSLQVGTEEARYELLLVNRAVATVPEDDAWPSFEREASVEVETGGSGGGGDTVNVSKTANRIHAVVGDTITYTVVIENNTNTVMNSRFHDNINPGTEEIFDITFATDDNANSGSYRANNNQFEITVVPGGRLVIQYKYTISRQDLQGQGKAAISNRLEEIGGGGRDSNTCLVDIPRNREMREAQESTVPPVILGVSGTAALAGAGLFFLFVRKRRKEDEAEEEEESKGEE